MHLVEVTPAPCVNCGTGNVPDQHGDRRQFIDLERDVNWNDPLLICEDCALSIGGMIGMISPDGVAGLKQELRDKDKEIHELKVEMDAMQRRARKLGIEFVEAAA